MLIEDIQRRGYATHTEYKYLWTWMNGIPNASYLTNT